MFLQGETLTQAQEPRSPGASQPRSRQLDHPRKVHAVCPGMVGGGSRLLSCPKSRPRPKTWEMCTSHRSTQLYPAVLGYPSSGPLSPVPPQTRSETQRPPPSGRSSSVCELPQDSQELENHAARKNLGDQPSHVTIRKQAPVTGSQTGLTSTAKLASQCSFLPDTDVPIVMPRKPEAGSEVAAT